MRHDQLECKFASRFHLHHQVLALQFWKILFTKLELRSRAAAHILCLEVAQLHAANLSGDSLWQVRKFDASNPVKRR